MYATAVFESILAKPESMALYIKNLKEKLRAERKKGLLRAIARELQKLIIQKKHREKIIITIAREKDIPTAKIILKKLPWETFENKNIVEKIDSRLIGGVCIETWNKRYDQSYKRKLLNLYDSLVTK